MLECRVQAKIKSGRVVFCYFDICGLVDWKTALKIELARLQSRIRAEIIEETAQIFLNERWIDVYQ